MQEVAAGRLSLAGTIRDYLPTFAGPTAGAITLRQLLQHQSGLPNPDDTPPDAAGTPRFYTERGGGITNGARTAGYCAGATTAPPGGDFSYNNCDYLVLGAILERVTGLSFGALVQARLAKPLHLTSLRLAADGAPGGGAVAVGYAAGGAPGPGINVATFGAAGALTGTARDLVILDLAMMRGAVLSAGARDTLWQGNPALSYQALGVWSYSARLRGCAAPVALVERRGSVADIQVRNVLAPALGRAFVMFVNDDAVEFGEVWQATGLAYELLSAAFCPPPAS
jgi:CubicO group peptidase (beta-lactamase class C family)